MDLHDILTWTEVALSVVLVVLVLLQQTDSGVGGAFGGGDGSGTYRTKRGMEKTLFNATIIVGILFALTALAIVLI